MRSTLEVCRPSSPTQRLQTAGSTQRRFTLFRRVWAVFGLLLFASSWRLWTPQTQFPQIPFFEFLIDVPGWVDWLGMVLTGLSLILCACARHRSHVTLSLLVFSISVSVLILLNQHRMQPWAYQFLVFAIIMATARPKTALFWMRWIVISIYIFSAISKFDYQFFHTVGREMQWSLFGSFGVDSRTWPEVVQHWIVFTFPLAELLIGVTLAISKFRRIGAAAAIMMHVVLLIALIGNVDGPGVLIWNLYFVAQTLFLFGPRVESETNFLAGRSELGSRARPERLQVVPSIVSIVVILFPLTEPIGICDHWPAWQLYAPSSSRAKLSKSHVEAEDLIWSDIPKWSTRSLRVPVYPQARFQFAVAISVHQKFADAHDYRIEVAGKSDRWTGIRITEALTGPDQFKMQLRQYRLNTSPRSFWWNDPLATSEPGQQE